jgi:hypothetical protein
MIQDVYPRFGSATLVSWPKVCDILLTVMYGYQYLVPVSWRRSASYETSGLSTCGNVLLHENKYFMQ